MTQYLKNVPTVDVDVIWVEDVRNILEDCWILSSHTTTIKLIKGNFKPHHHPSWRCTNIIPASNGTKATSSLFSQIVQIVKRTVQCLIILTVLS